MHSGMSIINHYPALGFRKLWKILNLLGIFGFGNSRTQHITILENFAAPSKSHTYLPHLRRTKGQFCELTSTYLSIFPTLKQSFHHQDLKEQNLFYQARYLNKYLRNLDSSICSEIFLFSFFLGFPAFDVEFII